MAENTILPSLESTNKPLRTYKIIPATVIPVEVFVIFLTNMHVEFTTNELVKFFYARHKITLSRERVQQICNDLATAGKLNTRLGRSKKNNLATFYQFNTIL